jgi:hypothetical protein
MLRICAVDRPFSSPEVSLRAASARASEATDKRAPSQTASLLNPLSKPERM